MPIRIVPCGKVISHVYACKARWSSTHDALLCSFPVAQFQSQPISSYSLRNLSVARYHSLNPPTSTYSSHSPILPPDPAASVTLSCSGTGQGGQFVHQFERQPWCIAINFNRSCQHSPSSSAGMECQRVHTNQGFL